MIAQIVYHVTQFLKYFSLSRKKAQTNNCSTYGVMNGRPLVMPVFILLHRLCIKCIKCNNITYHPPHWLWAIELYNRKHGGTEMFDHKNLVTTRYMLNKLDISSIITSI